MKLSVSLLCTFFLICNVHAQRDCGTTPYTLKYFKPSTLRPSGSSGHERDTVPNEIITIPVVVHLLFNTSTQNISDEQIRSQIEVLNRDFRRLNTDAVNTPEVFKINAADSRIMFCLAQVDPQGHPSKGIVRKYTTKEFFLGDDGMKYSLAG